MQEDRKSGAGIGFLTDDETNAPSNYDEISKHQSKAKKRQAIQK